MFIRLVELVEKSRLLEAVECIPFGLETTIELIAKDLPLTSPAELTDAKTLPAEFLHSEMLAV